MAIKLADTLAPMSEFPAAMAEHIGFSDGATLQEKFDNKELGGGDSSVTLTQQEYEALTEEERLNGLYYTYDTKRIYKNGVQYGASEPIPLTMEEYKTLKEAGAIDEQQEYLVEADAEGILLEASDIGYSNAASNLPCTTVQGAIDKVNDKVDNLIDDEVSDSTVWSSKKTSDEIDALISDASSTTSTYSSAKIDEKIAEHSLPLLYDTGMITNSSVIIFKLANVLKKNVSKNFNNLNLLLSTRCGDEVEIVTGKNDNDYWIQAYRRSDSATKISAMYKDGDDVYIKLESYANFLRVYHKSGVLRDVLRDDFAVSKVDTIPDTATEVTIRPLPTYVSDNSTNSVSTWSSSKINSKLGGLSFSASGTTLSITDGTNTWTLKANS